MKAMSDRQQIAAGVFFTAAEIAAKPHRSHTAVTATPSDPNNRPPSTAAREAAASPGVCAWCYQPGDSRSSLVQQADHYYRHPECQEASTQ